MRVKLGKRIYLCTVATHSDNSNLILLTTSNGVYTVAMSSKEEAENCHGILLKMVTMIFLNMSIQIKKLNERGI